MSLMSTSGDRQQGLSGFVGERRIHNEAVVLRHRIGLMTEYQDWGVDLIAHVVIVPHGFARKKFILVRAEPYTKRHVSPQLLVMDEVAAQAVVEGNVASVIDGAIGICAIRDAATGAVALGTTKSSIEPAIEPYRATKAPLFHAAIDEYGRVEVRDMSVEGTSLYADWSEAFAESASETVGIANDHEAKILQFLRKA